MTIAETIDRPFGLPELITVVLDLPFPPSVNAIWRSVSGPRGNVMLSRAYKEWKKQADLAVIVNKTWRRVCIQGWFEAHIALNADIGKWGDIDNRVKAVMDWAQSRALVTNDKNCRRLIVEWVDHADAPEGARLTLRELVTPK